MQSWIPLFPESASTMSGQVDMLYFYLVAVTAFFTVLITVVVIFFAIKYRQRAPNETPRPNAGSLKLETLWTVIPFLISMSMFVWGAGIYFAQYRIPKDAMEITVVGKQWMWKFQHPTGQREINELHIPIGQRVKLTMTTEDVLHSMFIPAFRVKQDVVPGRYTSLWFEATKPGTYHLFCAEYCGTNHSGMGGSVVVMSQEDFSNWLAGNANQQSPVAAGQALFTNTLGCASCHGDKGQGGRGPALTGLLGKQVQFTNGTSTIADEAYIRESVLEPQAKIVAGYGPIMPTFAGQLNEEQLLQLISFVKSLSPTQSSGLSTAAPAAKNNPQTGPATPAGTGAKSTESQRSNPLSPTAPTGNKGNTNNQSGGQRPNQ